MTSCKMSKNLKEAADEKGKKTKTTSTSLAAIHKNNNNNAWQTRDNVSAHLNGNWAIRLLFEVQFATTNNRKSKVKK